VTRTSSIERKGQESNLQGLCASSAFHAGAIGQLACPSVRASGGTRTHTVRFTRAVLGLSSIAGMGRPARFGEPRLNDQGGRWESNPHMPGSQPGPAAALGSATVSLAGVEPA
jgi:hypothetical protein